MADLNVRIGEHERAVAPAYKPLYRSACLPNAEWQRSRLEALRYKWCGYRHAMRWMQRLGDVGRQWIPGLQYVRLGPASRMPDHRG